VTNYLINYTFEILHSENALKTERKIFGFLKQKPEVSFSSDSIWRLSHFLMKLDEKLYAMSKHKFARKCVKELWGNQTARVHTAFGRLGSFLNWPKLKYSQIELAEAGLMNIED